MNKESRCQKHSTVITVLYHQAVKTERNFLFQFSMAASGVECLIEKLFTMMIKWFQYHIDFFLTMAQAEGVLLQMTANLLWWSGIMNSLTIQQKKKRRLKKFSNRMLEWYVNKIMKIDEFNTTQTSVKNIGCT